MLGTSVEVNLCNMLSQSLTNGFVSHICFIFLQIELLCVSFEELSVFCETGSIGDLLILQS